MAGTSNCGSIKWGAQQIAIMTQSGIDAQAAADPTTKYNIDCSKALNGVQSIGYDANFEQTPTFQIGQTETYEINEGIPQVDITISKALDGYCPVYLAATAEATTPSLFGRAPCKSVIAVSYFPCTVDSATGTATSTVVFPEAQVNSISYTFGVDGVFTEDVSFLGNNVLWFYDPDGNDNLQEHLDSQYPTASGFTTAFLADIASISFSGCFPGNDDVPNCKTQFKEDFIWAPTASGGAGALDENGSLQDCDLTVVPQLIGNINSQGVNSNDVAFQSITVSTDLNREEIFQLGNRGPVTRTITPPIAVNTSFETVSETGPLISALEDGIFLDECVASTAAGVSDAGDEYCTQQGLNLGNYTIRIATCGGLRIYTGTRNKLASYNVSGASTGGENLTVTYNFQTFNTMVVLHSNDTFNPNGATMWNARDTYLGCT